MSLKHCVQQLNSKETLHHGTYEDFFTKKEFKADADTLLDLKAWDYKVFVKK